MAPTPTYIENVDNNDTSDKNDEKKSFPFEIQDVDEATNRELLELFTGEKTGFVQVGPKKYFLPSGYKREAHNFYNFKPRTDDVFVVTFPRSGTTWTQEMVWLLANNLDYNKAMRVPLSTRFPFLEFSCFVHPETKKTFLRENQYDINKYKIIEQLDYPGWKYLQEMKERRFIKTHLPFSLLPPNLLESGCKVIYVARNPKDVAVSYYHLNRSYRTQGFIGDFKQFWKYFQRNLVPWSPYWEHIKEGWIRKHEKNMLFLFYEDINKDLKSAINKVSNFLGKQYSEEEINTLKDYISIDNFKHNKMVNNDDHKDLGVILSTEENFVRKGKNGGWRTYFDDQLTAEADDWIADNLSKFNIVFPSLSEKSNQQ